MEIYQNLWNSVKNDLEETFDENTFSEVFSNINNIHKFYNSYIYLIVENEFIKTRINRLYVNKINELLTKYTSNVMKFKFVVKEELIDDPKNLTAPEKNLENKYRLGNLNATYNFNNFVVGKSNNFAFKMAMKVADQPGLTANPFYIFGDVGLGKTHLMQAIGNYILDQKIDTKILYIKADSFIEDYTSLLKKERMEDFNEKYRDLDVLLIDDIQMLGDAKKTQMEFFKLFDILCQANKQIVITSDKPAQDLTNIMSRLTSRFSAGLIADIQAPDINHRIQILEKKLLQEAPNDNTFPKDVIEFIARTFQTNIRELEGALKRVLFFCVAYEKDITIDNAQEALDALLRSRKESDKLNENNYDKVQSIVASSYGITINDLIGKSRLAKFTLPRHIAMYLLKDIYNLPYKKIGLLFNGRDHSTVLAACEKIDNDLKNDDHLKQQIALVRKKLAI